MTLPSCSSRTTSGRPTANGSPSGTVAPGGSVWRSPASSMWTLRASETRIRTCSARSTSGRSPRIRVTASARSVSAASSALRRSISRRSSRSRAIARWRSPRIEFWRMKASAPATDQAAPQTQIASVDAPPTTSSTASDAGKIVRYATGASSLRAGASASSRSVRGRSRGRSRTASSTATSASPTATNRNVPPAAMPARQDPVADAPGGRPRNALPPRDSRAPSPARRRRRPAGRRSPAAAATRPAPGGSPKPATTVAIARPSSAPSKTCSPRASASALRSAASAATASVADARSTRIVAADGVTRRPSARRRAPASPAAGSTGSVRSAC